MIVIDTNFVESLKVFFASEEMPFSTLTECREKQLENAPFTIVVSASIPRDTHWKFEGCHMTVAADCEGIG